MNELPLNVVAAKKALGIVADRRQLLKGAGALGALMLVRPAFGAAAGASNDYIVTATGVTLTGIVVPQVRGLFGDNGATPWYASVTIGTAERGASPQVLKIALDTGSNFIWCTSSLCDATSNSCTHLGGDEFIWQNSTSFTWVSQTPIKVDFGPWGNMMVETGQDQFLLPDTPNQQTVTTTFYLAASYSGPQFAILDWDGGIGIPSSSLYAQTGITYFVEQLFNLGLIDTANPWVSFDWDAKAGTGTCQIGGRNPPVGTTGVVLPWSAYTGLSGCEYLWTTKLGSYSIGNYAITDQMFCLDSGSSQFKGDDEIMQMTLDIVNVSPLDVVMTMGTIIGGNGPGTLTIPASVYEVKIEAGKTTGQTTPQFQPLGLPGLVLVGSVLMDYLYTVFEWSITKTTDTYTLTPTNMYLYNKVGGLEIISDASSPGGTGTVSGSSVD